MSKAILVMDMPESCAKCGLFSPIYNDMTCHGNGWTINYPYPDKARQDWCPLKPMPEKKEWWIRKYVDQIYRRGKEKVCSTCIDEILKEGDVNVDK